MAIEINSTSKQFHAAPLGKRILEGAAISLTLFFIFLFGAGQPEPHWEKHWVIKPLTIVALAGAVSAIFFYAMDDLRYKGGWKKTFANFSSLVVFLVALWLAIVLGLNGTMWD